MPIEVEAFAPEEVTEGATEVAIEPTQDNSHTPPQEEAAPSPVERSKAKAHGRPRGSKNRPKTPAEVAAPEGLEEVIVKRKPKQVVYISESEDEELTPPPSPDTQRRNAWVAYRQKQVCTLSQSAR